MKLNDKLIDYKKNKYSIRIIDYILAILGILLLVIRVRYGIDFTDETWYVSEPYLVAKGALPYVDIWNQAPGFSLPLAVFYKLYHLLFGTEAIFMFSRVLYCFFCISVSIISLHLISYSLNTSFIGFLLPLLNVFANSLYDINYNTIGLYYLFLSASILYFISYCSPKNGNIWAFISGILIARAVMGTPAVAIAVIICMTILVYECEWKKLELFIAGGCSFILAIFLWLICKCKNLYYIFDGIVNLVSTNLYLHISRSDTLYSNVTFIAKFFWPFFILISITGAIFFVKKITKTIQYLDWIIYIVIFVFAIYGVILYFRTFSYYQLLKYTWYMALFVLPKEKNEKAHRLSYIVILYFSTYIVVSLTNINGFTGARLIWLYIPTIISGMSIEYVKIANNYKRIALFLSICIIGFAGVFQNYSYVYRDDNLNMLKSKVSRGVWKGCLTSESRATAVIELEDYVKKIARKDEKVLFLDWVGFGYLMTEAEACTPTTLDPMTYSYETNNPEIMYKYFDMVNDIPDKIIYIDFGRNDILSIEDANWKFNEFVFDNYIMIDSLAIKDIGITNEGGKGYRVLCYQLIDRKEAMQWVEARVE